jgi:hypothetical protein
LQALVKGLAQLAGARQHLRAAARVALRDAGRHVLLDGAHLPERVVPGAVDDAEAAFAELGLDLEFVEPETERQRLAAVLGRLAALGDVGQGGFGAHGRRRDSQPAARRCRISNAGRVLPSSTSRKAPPPVEM